MPEALRDQPHEPEIVSTEVVFDGMVWDVRRETFANGDGRITREFVAHTGAVAVLALDERDNVLLIRQYRHPIRTREWELPAGLLDQPGESPLLAAQRELAEEVDLAATEWAVLSDFATTPGGSNERLRIYLARGLSDTAAFERTEEEADIEKRWASLDEVVDAVLARDVQNSILVIGALAAQASRSRGWAPLAPADSPWPEHPLR
ncbi:MAG: NUDIX hydrolase [Rhodoglobus sp.]